MKKLNVLRRNACRDSKFALVFRTLLVVIFVLSAQDALAVYTLTDGTATVDISETTGAIVGGWKGVLKVIDGTNDIYAIENLSHAQSQGAEQNDAVTSADVNSSSVSVTCTNSQLAGLTIIKEYRFNHGTGNLVKKVSFTNNSAEAFFLKYYAVTNLDTAFRTGGRYYFLGGTFREAFTNASSVTSDTQVMQNVLEWDQHWVLFQKQTEDTAITQYRYRVNDQYCMPSTIFNWEQALTWTATGWKIGVHADFLAVSGGSSGETHYYFGQGSPLEFISHFNQLPDVAALNNEIQVADWVAKVQLDDMVSPVVYSMIVPRITTSTKWNIPQDMGDYGDPCDSGLASTMASWALWSKTSTYTMQWAVSSDSNAYAEHPEYVITNDTNDPDVASDLVDGNGGEPVYLKQLREPGCVQYFLDQVTERMQVLSQSFVYIDGDTTGVSRLDWRSGNERVSQGYDWIDFFRQIRQTARTADPNRDAALFTNGLTPFSDITYMEVLSTNIGTITGANWRKLANIMMLSRVLQPKEHPICLLYWRNWDNPNWVDNEPVYSNYAVGMGLMPSSGHLLVIEDANTYVNVQKRKVYIDAAYEFRGSELVDGVISPRWYSSDSVSVECYSLVREDYTFVPVLNRSTGSSVIITLDSSELGLTANRNVWVLDQQLISPPALTAPDATSAMQNQTLQSVSYTTGNLPITTYAREDLLTHLTITQLPVFVTKIEGDVTQTLSASPAEVEIEELYWDSGEPNTYHFTADVDCYGCTIFIPLAAGQSIPSFIRVDGDAKNVTAATVAGIAGYSFNLLSGLHTVTTASFTLGADLNGDGIINFIDYAILGQEFLMIE